MTDPFERSRIIGEVRAAWAATPSAHSMVLDAREVDALLEAADERDGAVKEMEARELHHFEAEKALTDLLELSHAITQESHCSHLGADIRFLIPADVKRTTPAEPLTDVELVAVYDAGWNGLDDGTVRVAVLEVAAIRAVYEAGRH